MPPRAAEWPAIGSCRGYDPAASVVQAARIRSRSSSWGYGGIVGSQLDGSLAGLEIWITGGEVGAAAAPPVEGTRGHTSFWDAASVHDVGRPILKERTLVVSLLILTSPLLILASRSGESSHSIRPNSHFVGREQV